MTPLRCGYCGALTENPVRLAWAIPEEDEPAFRRGSMPLCLACSQSWLPQPEPARALVDDEKFALSAARIL